jgi:transcriptional regulator GlxA family with amidase domain
MIPTWRGRYSKTRICLTISARTRRTAPFGDGDAARILLIPEGKGTRGLIGDAGYISWLGKKCEAARFVLTVCTGSALLARTGLLDGLRATTNKIAFDWVSSQRERVKWKKRAIWVMDGKYYTSSGVSAGIDMALGFIGDQNGAAAAREVATQIEYVWNGDSEDDPFAL